MIVIAYIISILFQYVLPIVVIVIASIKMYTLQKRKIKLLEEISAKLDRGTPEPSEKKVEEVKE